MSTFEGIPVARAAAFYAELEENNTRDWWQAHSTVYQQSGKEPLTALLARLEPQFGPSKIFRPHRDVRFSQDKSPYKTAQGAFASYQEGVGYYLQLSADGLLVGGGYHSHSPAQLARYRNAVDAAGTGEQLQHIVDSIAWAGFRIEGEKLKTVPRSYAKDHPRAELLKHKSLSASVALRQPAWLPSPAAEDGIGRRCDLQRPRVE